MEHKIQLLGFSKAKATILQDILDAKYLVEPLTFILNIEVNTDIDFYTKAFPYKIFQPGTYPDPKAKYIFGTSGPKNKVAIFQSFTTMAGVVKDDFMCVIHPMSFIASTSIIHPGCVIESMVSISSQTEIGFGVDIKRGVQVGHHNKIGEFSDINPGAILCGYVTLGHSCYIGAGAVIRDGISIGENSTIGMGSVVTTDIPANTIAYGNPCKVIRMKSA